MSTAAVPSAVTADPSGSQLTEDLVSSERKPKARRKKTNRLTAAEKQKVI